MSKAKLTRKIVMAAIPKSHGITQNVAAACKVSRVTLWKWLKKHKDISALIEQEVDEFVDVAESQLYKKVMDGDIAAIIYTLKTRGRKRGWGERMEFAGAKDAPLKIKVTIGKDGTGN